MRRWLSHCRWVLKPSRSNGRSPTRTVAPASSAAFRYDPHRRHLVHDGVGIWLAARRLNQGKFHWPGTHRGHEVELDAEQLQALVLGLPWQRVGANGAITLL
ncbi:IS66 family insertion sequence element accessory protein TnpB [Pseudomonas coleopterorum]|uniref:IS66 family insertion sequence element accessory protein TnpB n=1 Tax=Pseudomonas coleopterorum TaxID=1605838 RepID=UPI0028AE3436|nr:IS66 family insertion sequence element accessory protein TnpB [Pseudomonas coleopterorum]